MSKMSVYSNQWYSFSLEDNRQSIIDLVDNYEKLLEKYHFLISKNYQFYVSSGENVQIRKDGLVIESLNERIKRYVKYKVDEADKSADLYDMHMNETEQQQKSIIGLIEKYYKREILNEII
jgi:hypothetical protein